MTKGYSADETKAALARAADLLKIPRTPGYLDRLLWPHQYGHHERRSWGCTRRLRAFPQRIRVPPCRIGGRGMRSVRPLLAMEVDFCVAPAACRQFARAWAFGLTLFIDAHASISSFLGRSSLTGPRVRPVFDRTETVAHQKFSAPHTRQPGQVSSNQEQHRLRPVRTGSPSAQLTLTSDAEQGPGGQSRTARAPVPY